MTTKDSILLPKLLLYIKKTLSACDNNSTMMTNEKVNGSSLFPNSIYVRPATENKNNYLLADISISRLH